MLAGLVMRFQRLETFFQFNHFLFSFLLRPATFSQFTECGADGGMKKVDLLDNRPCRLGEQPANPTAQATSAASKQAGRRGGLA